MRSEIVSKISNIINNNRNAEKLTISVTLEKSGFSKIDYHAWNDVVIYEEMKIYPYDFSKYAAERDRRGFSDCQVSRLTGVNKARISEWKKGKNPSRNAMENIAKLFGKEPEFFAKEN